MAAIRRRPAAQVVATFDNAFQSTGNSTFTAMTSATNPFRSARDNSGRLIVNEVPLQVGTQVCRQRRMLIVVARVQMRDTNAASARGLLPRLAKLRAICFEMPGECAAHVRQIISLIIEDARLRSGEGVWIPR